MFTSKWNVSPSALDHALIVSTPTGDQINTRTIYYDCILEIGGTRMPINLILQRIEDFDVILGVDWLSDYRVVMDCFNKMVPFDF